MEAAFTAIVSMWKKMVELSLEHKKGFQDDADECMRFFNGPYDFLYKLTETAQRGDFIHTGGKNTPKPSIAMTINKAAELVQLFGPNLYHKNPTCKVNPRKPPDIPLSVFGNPQDPMVQQMVLPMVQQINQGAEVDKMRSILLESYLNYLPEAIGLKENMRDVVDESIIKGRGVAWAETYRPVGSPHKLVGLFYDTVDNLAIDPDHESLEAAKWIARRCCKPVWEVELEYGLPPGTLKGNYESHSHNAAVESLANEAKKREGKTNDLLVYWKVYSKMGMGALLRGISKDAAKADSYGRYVQIVYCENYNFPLNLPPSIWESPDEMYRRAQWETPFWADDGWPCEVLDFHRVPRQVWPMSHLRPGLGQLKFLNWAYSFLASKMQKTSRTFIACMKAASEEIKSKVLEGSDLELIEFEQSLGKSINDIVGFLDHPEIKGDFIKIIEMVNDSFEKATGLSELIYGTSSRQMRSAEEANVKQTNMNIRPDDMANKTETFMTRVFRKMGIMARWHCGQKDVLPVFGPVVANLWTQYVESANLPEIVHGLDMRIEAGSAKKPNQAKMEADAEQLMQTLMPFFAEYAGGTGNVGPVNAVVSFWGKAHAVDVSEMMLPPPPPQPQGPTPEQIAAQESQQEMQQSDAQHQQEMEQGEEEHDQDIKFAKEKQKADMAIVKKKAAAQAAAQKSAAAKNGK